MSGASGYPSADSIPTKGWEIVFFAGASALCALILLLGAELVLLQFEAEQMFALIAPCSLVPLALSVCGFWARKLRLRRSAEREVFLERLRAELDG